MPQRLQAPETFNAWMEVFNALVTTTYPEEAQPQDRADREAWPWWKVKKWALHICNRLFSRYGDPKESRSASMKQFAQRFASDWSCKARAAAPAGLPRLASPLTEPRRAETHP